MRLIALSDVHANLPALQAVLQHMTENFGSVDHVLCAGDLVGIGPFPNEVCDILREMKNLIAVKGEFDQAVIDGNTGGIDPLLAETIEWTRAVISEKNMDFICELDGYKALKLGQFKVLLIHGSPKDYLNGEIIKMETLENLQKYFETTEADIIICGQGHIPFVKDYNGRFIINAGSVGQPKDDNSKASYAFVDTETKEINFQRVRYNLRPILEKMKEEKFSEILINNFYFL